jgi:lysozyme
MNEPREAAATMHAGTSFLRAGPPASMLLLAVAVSFAAGCGGEEDLLGSGEWAVHTVCGGSDVVKGIDVSYYQGTINWTNVKNAGIVYGIARVSDGTGYIDSQFAANWQGMKNAGIIRAAYQYFRPNQSASAQATLFVQKIQAAGGFQTGDLPGVIDFETMGAVSSSTAATAVSTWLTQVKAATGRIPIIYTGSYFWDSSGLGTGYTGYPLWTAHYTSATCPLVPNAWSAWKFWQYSDSGSVSGISGNVDMDRWNGTLAELKAFATASVIPSDGGSTKKEAGAPKEDGKTAQGDGSSAAADGQAGQVDQAPWSGGDAYFLPEAQTGQGGGGCSCELAAGGAPARGPLAGFLLTGAVALRALRRRSLREILVSCGARGGGESRRRGTRPRRRRRAGCNSSG